MEQLAFKAAVFFIICDGLFFHDNFANNFLLQRETNEVRQNDLLWNCLVAIMELFSHNNGIV